MDRPTLRAWLTAYECAWRTAGTEALADLFAPEATYRMNPYEEPYRGLRAIAAMWDAEREGPNEVFTMSSRIIAVEGDTGVVRLNVTYGAPPHEEYRDLWIVNFDEHGRCQTFEEWPFWPSGTERSFAD